MGVYSRLYLKEERNEKNDVTRFLPCATGYIYVATRGKKMQEGGQAGEKISVLISQCLRIFS